MFMFQNCDAEERRKLDGIKQKWGEKDVLFELSTLENTRYFVVFLFACKAEQVMHYYRNILVNI